MTTGQSSRVHRRISSTKLIPLKIMAHSTLGVGNPNAPLFYKTEIKTESLEDFQRILDSTTLDLSAFKSDMAYAGFDKDRFGRLAAARLGGFRTVKLVVLAGMRGTNLRKILEKSVKVDSDVKECFDKSLILSNGTGPDDLTMGRLIAVFPEIAVFYLEKHKVGRKIISCACPASIQFPAAAGLPMSPTVRQQHVEFCREFSKMISKDKKFDPKFYRAAFNGQQSVIRLHDTVLKICGTPTDELSRAVDIDTMLNDHSSGGVRI